MFNIGFPEMLIILAIALIVFGPNKLPELAKSFGKALREFKKATEEVKESFREETKELEDLKSSVTHEDFLSHLAEESEDLSESGKQAVSPPVGASDTSATAEPSTGSVALQSPPPQGVSSAESARSGVPPDVSSPEGISPRNPALADLKQPDSPDGKSEEEGPKGSKEGISSHG